jgi:lycopene beta-cyclase
MAHPLAETSPYDIIITGGGMAGLSLVHHIRRAGLLSLRILLIDREPKRSNDRTWCYWEHEPDPFEAVVHRSWDHVAVHGGQKAPLHLPLGDYRYKMIRGIDFYAYMDRQMESDTATTRLLAQYEGYTEHTGHVEVHTSAGDFQGQWLFDSTRALDPGQRPGHHLLQHFLGYLIQTDQPVFDTQLPDLMHFGIPQQNQCRFIYVLPLAADRALIEFTVFSEQLLTRQAYEAALESYIAERTRGVKWQVLETEYGVIPMSDAPVQEFVSDRVIHIGTAGGYTNPATGYTFRPTQKRLAQLVAQYQRTGSWQAPVTAWQQRFRLYASVMLNVLQNHRVPAPELFYDLYARNPIERVFRFLDGESTFLEELKLMRTTAIRPFLAASADVLRKRVIRSN